MSSKKIKKINIARDFGEVLGLKNERNPNAYTWLISADKAGDYIEYCRKHGAQVVVECE